MRRLLNSVLLTVPSWVLAILSIVAATGGVTLAVALVLWLLWTLFWFFWSIHIFAGIIFLCFIAFLMIVIIGGGKDLFESAQRSIEKRREQVVYAAEKKKRGE